MEEFPGFLSQSFFVFITSSEQVQVNVFRNEDKACEINFAYQCMSWVTTMKCEAPVVFFI